MLSDPPQRYGLNHMPSGTRLPSHELAMFAPISPITPLTPSDKKRIGNKRCQTSQNLIAPQKFQSFAGRDGERTWWHRATTLFFHSKCGSKPHFNHLCRCINPFDHKKQRLFCGNLFFFSHDFIFHRSEIVKKKLVFQIPLVLLLAHSNHLRSSKAESRESSSHGWSTYPPLTYPPQK